MRVIMEALQYHRLRPNRRRINSEIWYRYRSGRCDNKSANRG
ncbi:hypothetical protein [Brachyspira pilosicoli]